MKARVRRELDAQKIGEGLARDGMDTRVWQVRGTVASVTGEEGGPNFGDPDAIHVTPLGVEVDVVLEGHGNEPVTCRYTGISHGAVSTLAPIRPGNQVLVQVVDGNLSAIPEITHVIPDGSHLLPVEEDGKPIFRNDRFSLVADGVPIEIQTKGGGKLRIETNGKFTFENSQGGKITVSPEGQIDFDNSGGGHLRINTDSTVQLGGVLAIQQLILGNVYRAAESAANTSVVGTAGSVASALVTAGGELSGSFGGTYPNTATLISTIAAWIAAWAVAFGSFEAGSGTYLSGTSKTT